jgi:hypothetical protein
MDVRARSEVLAACARNMRGWHAGRVLFALAQHFNWWETRMITEFEIDGGRADLLVVSKAGYATEIEIKISRKDWRADQAKAKFMCERPHISRMFYAVPAPLYQRLNLDQPPSWLKPHVGILVVLDGKPGYDAVREVRAATRFRARRLPDRTLNQIDTAFYYRFWRQHMEIQRQRLHGGRA